MPKTKQAVEQAAKLGLYIPQLDKLDERLNEFIEQDRCQAIVIKAMRYGVPIFEGCYGTSTNEYGVHLDTIFPVASNTKPIIATLIMILLEEGRLELETRISKFLPEYTGGGRENIQLWHFLTHTSGIVDDEFYKSIDDYVRNELKVERPDENNSTDEDWKQYDLKIKEALNLPEDYDDDKIWDVLSLKVDLKNQPRTIMSYCNHGYQKLKDVICAITGETIDSYAQCVLFDPLGMIDSHWRLPKEKYGRVLGRNEKCQGHGWINSEENYNRESGAGGLKTTANDMSNFCEMILNEGKYNNRRILSPASVREMTKNYNSSLPNAWDSWGLGWNYRGAKVDDAGVLRSERAIEHGGWAGHKILIDPDRGLSVIIYTGEYNEPNDMGSFGNWGKINNMVIAALD
ncbi:MAG: beta-lactamase family protein [Oscillospiraceae bacterium]|nr:beta-lactamase family protein [Oscillospiraceae bacterium]